MRLAEIRETAEATIGADLKLRATNCAEILMQGREDQDLWIGYDRTTGTFNLR